MAKKVIKKTSTTTKTTPVAAKALSNITNVEDFNTMIRDKYNETNEKKITKEEVSKVMKAFTDAFVNFASTVSSDEATCVLPAIGRFKVKSQPEHEGINPKTGEKITVAAKKRVSFKPFPKFVDTINE